MFITIEDMYGTSAIQSTKHFVFIEQFDKLKDKQSLYENHQHTNQHYCIKWTVIVWIDYKSNQSASLQYNINELFSVYQSMRIRDRRRCAIRIRDAYRQLLLSLLLYTCTGTHTHRSMTYKIDWIAFIACGHNVYSQIYAKRTIVEDIRQWIIEYRYTNSSGKKTTTTTTTLKPTSKKCHSHTSPGPTDRRHIESVRACNFSFSYACIFSAYFLSLF